MMVETVLKSPGFLKTKSKDSFIWVSIKINQQVWKMHVNHFKSTFWRSIPSMAILAGIIGGVPVIFPVRDHYSQFTTGFLTPVTIHLIRVRVQHNVPKYVKQQYNR